MPRSSSRSLQPDTIDRDCSAWSTRSLLFALAGLLLAMLSGCADREGDPPDLNQWPMAAAANPLATAMDVAWLSARERTALEGTWFAERVPVPGRVEAICRIPELDYRLYADCPLRIGFLVFHERGVTHVGSDSGGCVATDLTVDGALPPVRAAACVTPPRDDRGDIVALITGGEVPPLAFGGGDEPPPWVTSAEVRLAWVQGARLVVGAPEALAGTNPWQLRTGRFGGESGNVLVCTYTGAPFDEVTRRRPWIFRVTEDEDGVPHLEPRWRGTSFAHPFRDATLGDFTGAGEGEVAALEVSQDGGRMLTAYRFEGFGLEGLAPSAELPAVEDRLQAAHWVGGDADDLVVRTLDGRFLFYELDEDAEALKNVLTVEGPGTVLGWIVTSAGSAEPGELICVLPDGEVWRTNSSQQR